MKIVWLLPIVFVLCVLGLYLHKFGASLPEQREHWGQLGDFFGGVLNPIFALLAFFAVVYNSGIQKLQLAQAKEEYQAQIQTTRATTAQNLVNQEREDTLAVLKLISANLDELLNQRVLLPSTKQLVLCAYLVQEGARIGASSFGGGIYREFVENAKKSGTELNGFYLRVLQSAEELATFVLLLEKLSAKNSPYVTFYRHRYGVLYRFLQHVGGATNEATRFYDVSDQSAFKARQTAGLNDISA
jgi:hypothetical protein